MLSQTDTLKILGCSKASLSDYVKSGKLIREKKGRKTFYDEHEVTQLVSELKIKREKYRPDLSNKPKEKIELPTELIPILDNMSANENLNDVGYQYLAEAKKDLVELGLYKDCDKHILILYSISVQNYFKYLYSTNENDGIAINDMGTSAVHPHFKIMQHHEKMMVNYMDRLGLNPLSRTKLDIKEKETPISIMDELHKKETW